MPSVVALRVLRPPILEEFTRPRLPLGRLTQQLTPTLESGNSTMVAHLIEMKKQEEKSYVQSTRH
jgi:hypothetical protein